MENFEELLNEQFSYNKINVIGQLDKPEFVEDKKFRKFIFKTPRPSGIGIVDKVNLYIPVRKLPDFKFEVGATYDIEGQICTFKVLNEGSKSFVVSVVCDDDKKIKKLNDTITGGNFGSIVGMLQGKPDLKKLPIGYGVSGFINVEDSTGKKNTIPFMTAGEKAEFLAKHCDENTYISMYGRIQSRVVNQVFNHQGELEEELAHKFAVTSYKVIK